MDPTDMFLLCVNHSFIFSSLQPCGFTNDEKQTQIPECLLLDKMLAHQTLLNMSEVLIDVVLFHQELALFWFLSFLCPEASILILLLAEILEH